MGQHTQGLISATWSVAVGSRQLVDLQTSSSSRMTSWRRSTEKSLDEPAEQTFAFPTAEFKTHKSLPKGLPWPWKRMLWGPSELFQVKTHPQVAQSQNYRTSGVGGDPQGSIPVPPDLLKPFNTAAGSQTAALLSCWKLGCVG